ncbi:hypothetical protein N7517_000723 [Penicillium concentricum]|uniref:Uncharacterized protein n=1 Tax=Penicillium concentricum TaxID=293559 RepID=A0A9W9VI61_9EURO|nr:uncharacterized protein N7517_000723 [Penicillium concentricum]KAJ5382812.1 hypothetical protein N7517_000723 [Penicillium concentricum]
MAANPADHPTARDALDYAWLIPMLQDDSQPDPDQTNSATQDTIEATLKSQTLSATQDLLSGEIDFIPDAPRKHRFRTERAQQMRTSLGIDGDTYKQLIRRSSNPNLRPLIRNPRAKESDFEMPEHKYQEWLRPVFRKT